MWKGRKLDAGGTQVGRSADAKQTQRDAVRTHREAPISIDAGGTQEGRRREHQLLTNTYDIYCIWLCRSIKQIQVSFLVPFLYF